MKVIFQDNDENVLAEETLSDADVIAMDTDMLSKPDWIINAFREKIRRVKDSIVEKSGRGSRSSDAETKDQIILDLQSEGSLLVESAVDRQARLDADLSGE